MSKHHLIARWFDQYSADIFNFLLYRMGSADAEDAVQEVFIKAMKGLDTYQEKASPKTWLYSIARNVATDETRKRKRLKWKKLIPLEEKHEPKHQQTPEEILQLNEEYKEIFRAIQSLKESYKDVILLRSIEGFSVGETASILGWSEKKVHDTYYRARKMLQQKLGGLINGYE